MKESGKGEKRKRVGGGRGGESIVVTLTQRIIL